MNLVFGYEADGRVFPDADSAAGMLDKAIVGPLGLVQMIETQVGLLGPQVSNAARIATYATKLRVTGNGRFWAESYAKDPWTTASTLLDWRDGLVAGGWKGGEAGVARVDDLAAAETASPPLPAGISDRAAALIDAVPNRPGLRIRHLMLVEPRALLPVLWQRLIAILEQAGVIVSEEDPGVSSAQPGSDLFKVQNALAGGSLEPLCGDGTFTIVEADTELMAAEVVADWLAASPLEDLDGTVILEPTGDTSLLDHGLRARDVPALGLSAASPWRGALQVLPLAFAAAWRPFDPRVLLDLLLLPRPPIDGWAASLLSRALSTEPGIGGRAWRQAWDKIETRLVERFTAKDAASAQKKTETVLQDWRAWTETDSFDRRHGMPLADARAICGRVAAWAMRSDGGKGDRLLVSVASAAEAVSDALDRLELATVPALLLERILAQVLSEGVANPEHYAEAGGVRAVRAPGALWSAAARVVWWNFVGPGQRIASAPWDQAELAALAASGVAIETSASAARLIEFSHASVVLRTAERLVLVHPALAGDGQTTLHPLAHRLRPLLKEAAEAVRFSAERILHEPDARLAGRSLLRQPASATSPPVGVAVWTIDPDPPALARERRESATSLSRLLNCQLGWFAEDILNLRGGRFAEIPRTDQLFGNLAHEIARRLLPPGPPPPQEHVRAEAISHFETLLPEIAAPLLQPQHAGELAAAREMVPSALEALMRILHTQGLEVVGSELEREGMSGSLALQGRLDLLVRRGGQIAVLDLKWTRSERRYLEEVTTGRAIQLAIYRALSAQDGVGAPGGYFLLRQRRIIAGTGSILTDRPIEAEIADTDTLAHVASDWAHWRNLAAGGTLVAAGFAEAAAHRPSDLAIEAAREPCRYCNLRGLCRIHQELV